MVMTRLFFINDLQMTIRFRFLPQCIDLGLAAFLDDLGKATVLVLRTFICWTIAGSARILRPLLHLNRKKSARELRQKGSNYRCCIPALAGFVSPQSIAPDGEKVRAKFVRVAICFP